MASDTPTMLSMPSSVTPKPRSGPDEAVGAGEGFMMTIGALKESVSKPVTSTILSMPSSVTPILWYEPGGVGGSGEGRIRATTEGLTGSNIGGSSWAV